MKEIMRSNYSREERQKIVEEYIQSGKSQTVFAPEYGIKPNTLSAWVTKKKGTLYEVPFLLLHTSLSGYFVHHN